MHTRIQTVLERAGVASQTADTLAKLVSTPPSGSIDVAELSEANDVQLALLAAVVAATDFQQFGTALQQLLELVGAAQTDLSDNDSGRFWHLKGFAAWHLEDAFYTATRALNRSLAFLRGVHTPQAQAYLAHVYDTFGQLLHHQGLLTEARRDFELALQHRDPADEDGTALTLGNLGRLCLDLGDFANAATYFERDLDIVTRRTPELTRIRTQLLSHLGTCALECGRLSEARDYFRQSKQLAKADGNAYGLAFAALGLGKLALRRGKTAVAQRQAKKALTQLNAAQVPPAVQDGVQGLICQLLAEMHLKEKRTARAIKDFKVARQSFARATNVSPVETAQLLYGLARARLRQGKGQPAAILLREALHYLEPTTAEQMRQEIEAELHTGFPESWLLHTAGRFLGPREHTEFLLQEAGHGGFRGEEQDVVILFSDIRGFTGIAERFTPADLITFLNDYLGRMTRCVEMFGGMVDKFIGDAVMAVFSLPTPQPDDAERAVQAALMMRDELERFNHRLPAGTPSLAIGLGLHRGPVVAGLIGSPQKRSYTVIGDAVNTASRLESMTKYLGASILVSTEVAGLLSNPSRLLLRRLGKYSPNGRHTPVEIVDIMGEDDGSRFALVIKQEIAAVDQAFHCFSQRQFDAAQDAFMALAQEAETAGHNTRAHGYWFLAETADKYSRTPLPEECGYPSLALPADWDGTIIMMEK
jgi:class 3 adenylate cyclase